MAKRKPKERRPLTCRPDPTDTNKFWTCLDGEHEIPIEVRGLSTPEELEWFGQVMAKFLWEHRHLAKADSIDPK